MQKILELFLEVINILVLITSKNIRAFFRGYQHTSLEAMENIVARKGLVCLWRLPEHAAFSSTRTIRENDTSVYTLNVTPDALGVAGDTFDFWSIPIVRFYKGRKTEIEILHIRERGSFSFLSAISDEEGAVGGGALGGEPAVLPSLKSLISLQQLHKNESTSLKDNSAAD